MPAVRHPSVTSLLALTSTVALIQPRLLSLKGPQQPPAPPPLNLTSVCTMANNTAKDKSGMMVATTSALVMMPMVESTDVLTDAQCTRTSLMFALWCLTRVIPHVARCPDVTLPQSTTQSMDREEALPLWLQEPTKELAPESTLAFACTKENNTLKDKDGMMAVNSDANVKTRALDDMSALICAQDTVTFQLSAN